MSAQCVCVREAGVNLYRGDEKCVSTGISTGTGGGQMVRTVTNVVWYDVV